MPVSAILLDFAATVMAGIGLGILPRVWRGVGANEVQRAAAWWLSRESSRRAFARGGTAAILSFPWLALALWALDAHRYGHGMLSKAGLLVGISSAAIFAVIGVGLNVTVALFNWPKWVVPPSLRPEPGVLGTWLKKSP